jgi:chorismate mutase
VNERPIPPQVERLRERIEELDLELVHVLSDRFQVVEELSIWKNENLMSVEDPEREAFLGELYERVARQRGLDVSFVQRLFEMIIAQSRERQERAKNSKRA